MIFRKIEVSKEIEFEIQKIKQLSRRIMKYFKTQPKSKSHLSGSSRRGRSGKSSSIFFSFLVFVFFVLVAKVDLINFLGILLAISKLLSLEILNWLVSSLVWAFTQISTMTEFFLGWSAKYFSGFHRDLQFLQHIQIKEFSCKNQRVSSCA